MHAPRRAAGSFVVVAFFSSRRRKESNQAGGSPSRGGGGERVHGSLTNSEAFLPHSAFRWPRPIPRIDGENNNADEILQKYDDSAHSIFINCLPPP
jgi:hypothetical protein